MKGYAWVCSEEIDPHAHAEVRGDTLGDVINGEYTSQMRKFPSERKWNYYHDWNFDGFI